MRTVITVDGLTRRFGTRRIAVTETEGACGSEGSMAE